MTRARGGALFAVMKRTAAFTLLLATAPLAALPLAAAAQDQGAPVTITVAGQPVAFDQPPVERVGRVYVPLRGVFERLGASVVFGSGAIEATKGSTTVSLRIGSPTAIVNGQQTTLDAPPFLIGARTLVPLRFVAQALGATVNYDGNARTVAILPAAAPAPVVLRPAPRPTLPGRLVRTEPGPDTTVRGARPQIAATFPYAVDPDTVRVRVDDRDVTAQTYVSARAFSFDPAYDLPYGTHQVHVSGRGVDQTWSFANAQQPSANFLRDVGPPNGAPVGSSFTVQGFTRPYSRVHIVATANALVGFGDTSEATVTEDAQADPQGHFAREVRVFDTGAGVVDVRLEARAPDGGVATRTLRLRPVAAK
jgi:hypothetical protein